MSLLWGEENLPWWDWGKHPLVVLLVAACIGILLDRWVFSGSHLLWWTFALLFWLLWCWQWRCGRFAVSSWLLCASVAGAFGAWHHARWSLYPVDHLCRFASEEPAPVALRGMVAFAPELSALPRQDPLATLPQGVSSRMLVRATHLRRANEWLRVQGRARVWINGHLLGIQAGDHVQMWGFLSTSRQPRNPGEEDLGFADRSQRIVCRLRVSFPDCVTRRHSTSVPQLSAWLRAGGLRQLDRYLAPPQATLAGALLMGARDRLDWDRTEVFFHTGTIHLLAISGLHVGILAWSFFLAARQSWSSRRTALCLLIVLSLVYCSVTGMRAPVMRAAILIQVMCLGLLWRRELAPFNALAGAAILLLILRPAELFRAGAQLSFLAVATLAWLSQNRRETLIDPLDQLLESARPWHERLFRKALGYVRTVAVAGLAVWTVTLPLVMLRFHLISPAAIALNVVLTPPIALGLLAGFGVLITGRLLPPLAEGCGDICELCLKFVEFLVRHAHEIPGSHLWVAGPKPAWCAVFYGVLGILACTPTLQRRRGWCWIWLLVWLALPLGAALAGRFLAEPRPLRCTFLSVGHGTGVVIELPDGRVLLYDAGRMGQPRTGARVISQYLWHRGISHIDAVVISHADADHYNAVPELLDRFSVGRIFVSHVMFRDLDPGLRELQSSISARASPVTQLRADDVLRLGVETEIVVLHPLHDGVRGSDNANSLVLELSHQGKRILLPGDLEPPGIEDVMAEMPSDCDVLMAPHHGSSRSSPEEFADWCTPEWVVISGEEPETQRHLEDVFGRRDCRVLHTELHGAVTVTIATGKLRLRTFLPGN